MCCAATRKDGYLEGGGWLVSWCLGHLAGLADAATYNPDYAKWRYDDLPILPESWRFTIAKDKRDQFDVLRTLLRREDVTEVVNACDAGREGELIFRTVYCLAGCQKPMKRLWISSMEDSAIREGFANLRPGADYDGLHQAALCRAKADWLVGINATRLFSVLYHRTLNIGRVMSPTLALIVQRGGRDRRLQAGAVLFCGSGPARFYRCQRPHGQKSRCRTAENCLPGRHGDGQADRVQGQNREAARPL